MFSFANNNPEIVLSNNLDSSFASKTDDFKSPIIEHGSTIYVSIADLSKPSSMIVTRCKSCRLSHLFKSHDRF